jgi:hypothetical protein
MSEGNHNLGSGLDKSVLGFGASSAYLWLLVEDKWSHL